MDNLTESFFEGKPSTMTTHGPDVLSYRQQLDELERFCEPEPKSLLHEPDYKPTPGSKPSFEKVIDVKHCPYRKALVFTVYRPANPKTNSPEGVRKNLTIPDFLLSELGYGIPGEWKFKNDALNDGWQAADDLPDPFEDTIPFNPFDDGIDIYA
jgi:hypothetical protein